VTLTGMLAIGAGTARADASAPAPEYDSYSSQIFCDPFAPVSPVTWTETITQYGISYTSSFPAAYIRGGCSVGARYSLSYSYVYGGVTYSSPVTSVLFRSHVRHHQELTRNIRPQRKKRYPTGHRIFRIGQIFRAIPRLAAPGVAQAPHGAAAAAPGGHGVHLVTSQDRQLCGSLHQGKRTRDHVNPRAPSRSKPAC
jgi:hypothetical protein